MSQRDACGKAGVISAIKNEKLVRLIDGLEMLIEGLKRKSADNNSNF